jgi:hypothetical protein
MAVTLIVNNVPFEYPEQGEQQPWGESATNWAAEVTKVLASIRGPYDLLETAALINAEQLSQESIQGMFFDSVNVRSFIVSGNITRTTDTEQRYEEFQLTGLYQGTTVGWRLQQEGFGNSKVTFSITPSGQIQYTATALSGNQATYSGIIKFRGIGIAQT